MSFAQSTPTQEDPVKFEQVRFSYISPTKSKNKWAKAEIKIRSKGDLKAKAAGEKNDAWLKNVEIGFVCAYENSAKQMNWFSASAEFLAIEKGESYSVIFYIPAEALEMNNIIRNTPDGFVISLTADGVEYPMTANNWRERTNAKSSTLAKSLLDQAESNKSAGNMFYYEDAPSVVKYNDSGREQMPTPVFKK